MPYIEVPVSNGAALSQSLPWSNQQLENCYLNVAENGAFAQACLFGTDGINLLINTGATEINRGSLVAAEIPYFVNDTKLYKITRTIDAGTGVETWAKENLGTITGTGRVSMATNGTQLVIVVPGGSGFVYDVVADTFVTITDTIYTTTLGPANSVSYIDGFFVFTSAKTNNEDTFFHSNLNDATSYTATDFGTAAVDPDKIRTGHVHNNKFYTLGSKTIEVFDNVGGSGFVFQRRDGFVIPKGILANFSIAEYDGGFVFLGAGNNEQPAVWKLQGSKLTRLSTTPIQDQLSTFTDTEISNAFSWISGSKGAYFFNLSVGDKTFSYDSTASTLSQKKVWHNKTSFIDESIRRNRVNSAVTAYGRVMVGDSVSGRIGELDPDTYDEYGERILRVGSTQPLVDMSQEISIGSIELSIEAGVGDQTTVDPQLGLQLSFDGRTFNSVRTRSMGKQGKYNAQLIWDQNGMLDTQSVFRWSMSEKVKFVLMNIIVWVD